jgi:hypothetical protein
MNNHTAAEKDARHVFEYMHRSIMYVIIGNLRYSFEADLQK